MRQCHHSLMIQDAKETLRCCMTSFTNASSWKHVGGNILCHWILPSSPFPHHPFLQLHHFTKTPFRKTNRKVYSVFTLPAIHKTFTITFLFANRMWCSITLTHLLLFDTSMQFWWFPPSHSKSGFSIHLLFLYIYSIPWWMHLVATSYT